MGKGKESLGRPDERRESRAPAPSPDELRALQSGVGNAAIARALEGRPRPRGRGMAAGPIIARSMGIELESSNFEVDTAEQAKQGLAPAERLPPKGAPIAHGRGFQLQSEYKGDNARGIEFVTNPPGMATLNDWIQHAHVMASMAAEVERRQNRTFNAAELSGGDPRFQIKGMGHDLGAHVQVTLGVPLAAIPRLFELLAGKAQPTRKTGGNVGVQEQNVIGGAVDTARQVTPGLQQSLGLLTAPSGELLGLVTLIEEYLQAGASTALRTFPKAAVPIMTRTSFKRMFAMLPLVEQFCIQLEMQKWIEALDKRVTDVKQAGKSPVFKQTFYDPQSAAPSVRLGTTVGDWLEQMPDRDLMTTEGATTQAMGGNDPMLLGPRPPSFVDFVKRDAKYAPLAGSTAVMKFLATNQVTGETAMDILDLVLTSPDVPAKLKGPLRLAISDYASPTGEVAKLAQRPASDFKASGAGGNAQGFEDELLALEETSRMAKELYQGLGGLGDKVDTLEWKDSAGRTAEQEAVIVELRSVGGLGSVDKMVSWMQDIYGFADDAIKSAKPAGVGPDAKYEGKLSDKQQKMVDDAQRLRLGFAALANQVQQGLLTPAQAQPLAAGLAGGADPRTLPSAKQQTKV